MNEGEPTSDLGLEAQRGGTMIVRLSLEIEDSPVSWLYGRSRDQGGFPGQGTEHQAPPHHGDAATFLLLKKPAQEMQHHWTRAWNGVEVNPGKGKPRMGPRTEVSIPM